MTALSAFAFYVFSAVAAVGAILVIAQRNAVHALLYLVVVFLAVGALFFVLGAPFVAALEVIVYAGAIMVLFVFAIMMVNPRPHRVEGAWALLRAAAGPAALGLVLVAELVHMLIGTQTGHLGAATVTPKQVAVALFGSYVLGVELASMLLLAGLVGAYHLGHREPNSRGQKGAS